MARRYSSKKPDTLDTLIDRLPDRFLAPVPEVRDGLPVGLQAYITDLTRWVDEQLETPTGIRATGDSPGHGMALRIMKRIGAEPAQWYHVMVSCYSTHELGTTSENRLFQ